MKRHIIFSITLCSILALSLVLYKNYMSESDLATPKLGTQESNFSEENKVQSIDFYSKNINYEATSSKKTVKQEGNEVEELTQLVNIPINKINRQERLSKISIFLSSPDKNVRLAALDALSFFNPIEKTRVLIDMFNNQSTTEEERFKILSALNNAFLISEQDIEDYRLTTSDVSESRKIISDQISRILKENKHRQEVIDLALQISATTSEPSENIALALEFMKGKKIEPSKLDFIVNTAIFSAQGQNSVLPVFLEASFSNQDALIKLLSLTNQESLRNELQPESKKILIEYFLSQKDSNPDIKSVIEDSIKNLK